MNQRAANSPDQEIHGLIDVHAHLLPPAWRRATAERQGRSDGEPWILGRAAPDWSEAGHLAMMDDEGIALSVLSWPTATEGLPPADGLGLARQMNEDLAALVARRPTRFGAFAVLPLHSIEAMVTESLHALDHLGMDGIACTPQVGGQYLGQPCFDEWFAELDRRHAVLFMHPSVPPGHDAMQSIMHPAILEFMIDTTRAIGNLVFSGFRRRFPNIRLICTHGGGAAPYLAHRMGVLGPTIGGLFGGNSLSRDEVLRDLATFHFDLTAATSPLQVRALLNLVGAEKLLLGFDYPMMRSATIGPALSELWGNPALDAQQHRAIASENALALLPGVARRLAAG